MENNIPYLRKFGTVFAVSATLFLLLILFGGPGLSTFGRSRVLLIIVQLFPIFLIFINVGIVTEKWKAPAVAMGVFGIIIAAESLFFKNRDSNMNIALFFLIQRVLYLVPFAVLFLLSGLQPKKMPVILLSLFLLYGMTGGYDASQGYERLVEMIGFRLPVPSSVFRFMVLVTSQIVHVLFICEVLNYGEGKGPGILSRTLNPGNEYDKASGTIVFWSVKTFIYFSLLGSINMLSDIGRFGSYLSDLSFLKWYYLFVITLTVTIMVFAALYLRRFLLEYFMTYNFSSRFLYWFILLPVLGLFGWLVMLADSDKQTTFKEREKSISEFSANSPQSIIVIFSILIAIRLIQALSIGNTFLIITPIISMGLFALLVNSRVGYYINVYLTLVLLLFILGMMVFGSEREQAIFYLLPLLVMNLVQLFLIFPAFHFDAFNYITYEEEKPWEPGQDLF